MCCLLKDLSNMPQTSLSNLVVAQEIRRPSLICAGLEMHLRDASNTLSSPYPLNDT